LSAVEVMDHIGRDFATKGKWTNLKTVAAGEPWKGTLTVESEHGESGRYTATLVIDQAG
jgi:hypothetical protein